MNPDTTLTATAIAEKPSATKHTAAKCAHKIGMEVVEIMPGHATVTMEVQAGYADDHGVCHGGILATLAHACNSINEISMARGLSIGLVSSEKVGDQLKATAVEQSREMRTGESHVLVTSPDNKLVTIFCGRSFSRNKPIFTA
jgi:acyl-CoA thioesterase